MAPLLPRFVTTPSLLFRIMCHKMVNASKHKILVAAGTKAVYGMWFDPGHGYHVDDTKAIAKGNEPESLYAVMSGTHYNDACCFDYGNSENTRLQVLCEPIPTF